MIQHFHKNTFQGLYPKNYGQGRFHKNPYEAVLSWKLTKHRTSRIRPAGNYMFKVNNRNTRTRCEIRSKLTIKVAETRHWRRSGVFIVNLEHIHTLF